MNEGRATSWWLRGLCAFAALNSVAPLLAWVSGYGSFAKWYWFWTVPWLVVLIALSIYVSRSPRHAVFADDLRAGALGGLAGTILYDIVRIPFLMMGLRLLAPIDSYGVLIMDAAGSNPRAGLAGWIFHVSNGMCFGVAYGALMSRRHAAFGVAWGLLLESVAVLSPFALYYGLSHRWGLIAVAFAAHVPYGLAVGFASRDPARTVAKAREVTRAPVLVALAVTVGALVVWQRVWVGEGQGEAVAPGPSAVISGRDLSPQWIRVPQGGCAVIENLDEVAYTIGTTTIEPDGTGTACFTQRGVHRVKLKGLPWTGGFVIVDPEG